MHLLKLLFKLAVAGCIGVVVVAIVGKVRQRAARSPETVQAAADDRLSDSGFFLLNRDDARNRTVSIIAPPNCPSEEAQRARALGEALAQAGIPHEMKPGIQVDFHDPDDVARVNRHMANLANPLVIVRGWAKGNPSLQDIIAQYHSGQ